MMFGVSLGLDYPPVDSALGIDASALYQLAGQATDFSLRFTGAQISVTCEHIARQPAFRRLTARPLINQKDAIGTRCLIAMQELLSPPLRRCNSSRFYVRLSLGPCLAPAALPLSSCMRMLQAS